MYKVVILTLCLFLGGCGGGGVQDLLKPTTSDNKLAIVIKRMQYTTCKTSCLVDEYEEHKYINPDSGEEEVWLQCPLDWMEILCIDLYKQDGEGKNVVYKFSPQEWQKDAQHLFGLYAHQQIKRGIAQVEFLCQQDFALCENHLEPIEALVRFHYERGGE